MAAVPVIATPVAAVSVTVAIADRNRQQDAA
jgi:hypothetical protein